VVITRMPDEGPASGNLASRCKQQFQQVLALIPVLNDQTKNNKPSHHRELEL